jgi:hypothetical protein
VKLQLPKTIALLISLAENIVLMMTGNASLPNPTPKLAAVTAAILALKTAESAVQARVKGAVATRDAKRADLLLLLTGLKSYVQTCADADLETGASIIESAGMGVRKIPVRAKRVFAVTQGSVSGTVHLVAARAGHRAAYDWEWSVDGGKTWQLAPSTLQAKTSITGLVPGSSVSFRTRATTKAGEGDWSQPIAFVVK